MRLYIFTKFFLIAAAFIVNTTFTSALPSALIEQSDKAIMAPVAIALRKVVTDFAAGKGTVLKSIEFASDVRILPVVTEVGIVPALGVHTRSLKVMDMPSFKDILLSYVSAKSRQYTEFVGDTTTQFTVEGTTIARRFIAEHAEKAGMIGYGYTGYRKDGCTRYDGNSILSTLFEENPVLGRKAFGNIVGHNVIALEKWGCWATRNVGAYVIVYNDCGMDEGFTKFGEDIPASDHIFNAEDGDKLVLTEGGAQSFKQACNALRAGIKIQAMYGLRTPENLRFFSTAEFFAQFQEACARGEVSSPETAKRVLDKYLETHEAWNKSAVDADTKEKLFYESVESFWKEGLYMRVMDQVAIHRAS